LCSTFSISDDVRVASVAGTANFSWTPEFLLFFSGVCVARSLVLCVLFCRSMCVCDVRFAFTSSFLYDGSCLIYDMYVCLRKVVSNTYCVVFLFCLSSSCVQWCPTHIVLCFCFVFLRLVYSGVLHILCCVFDLFFFVLLLVSLDLPFLITPSVFSNVYLFWPLHCLSWQFTASDYPFGIFKPSHNDPKI